MEVKLEKQPGAVRLEKLAVEDWSLWEKEASKFDWSYSSPETCYIQEGEVTVHLPEGASVTARAGDLVQFPAGLVCTWEIKSDLSKVFTFDEVELNADESIEID